MPAEVSSRARVVALIVTLGLLASSCGGGGGSDHPIKIAFISDCTSGFSPHRPQNVAGAELPFLRRGAKLRGAQPADGVTESTIAGKHVQLLLPCESYPVFTTLIGTLGQVVEQDGAAVVVGTNLAGDGLVVKEYAKKHPEVTFLTKSGEQSTTLKNPVPNLFSFAADNVQESAGLGAYAYRALKLRRVVTVGENDPYGWAEVDGFAAEFCSLGGHIVQSRWTENFHPRALARLATKIPSQGVDGVALPTTSLPVHAFVNAWAKHHPHLGGQLLVNADSNAFDPPLTKGMLGLVGVSSSPLEPTAASRRFDRAAAEAFPHLSPDPLSYDSIKSVLDALERVHGDLSHEQQKFRRMLARIHVDGPDGPISLDRRRQAITRTYLRRIGRNESGQLAVRQIAVVPNVEQTFGGYFGTSTPAPGRHPLCRRGRPPAWVNSVPTTK